VESDNNTAKYDSLLTEHFRLLNDLNVVNKDIRRVQEQLLDTTSALKEANERVADVERGRYAELVGGDVVPFLEITSTVQKETPLNTPILFYWADSLEFFTTISITIRNKSKKYHLKNVQAHLTYPNDYLRHKYNNRRMIGVNLSVDDFAANYRILNHESKDLGMLPAQLGEQAFKFKLPTYDKRWEFILTVEWNNGFYSITIPVFPIKNYPFPNDVAVRYALDHGNYVVQTSRKGIKFEQPKFVSTINATNPDDYKVVIQK
jgi:hypothetical protein